MRITQPLRTKEERKAQQQVPAPLPGEEMLPIITYLRQMAKLRSISELSRFGRAVQSLTESLGVRWQMGHEPGLGYCQMFPRWVMDMVLAETNVASAPRP